MTTFFGAFAGAIVGCIVLGIILAIASRGPERNEWGDPVDQWGDPIYDDEDEPACRQPDQQEDR